MAPTIRLASLAGLSDADLLAQVARLAAWEREATVALIAHLAELDARRLYLAEGYPSLFVYCTQALHLSEHAAYGRIEAARAARRFPVLLDHLADGSITLTTVTLLAPHLTVENHRDLLEQARHRSRREVEALVAALRPLPPVPPSIRRLPVPRTAPAVPPSPAQTAAASAPTSVPEPQAAASPPPPVPSAAASAPAPTSPVPAVAPTPPAPPPAPTPPRPPVVAPLAPDRYKVQFTASAETCAKLRQAQDLLRHQIPDGDVAQVLDRALTVLVDTLLKRKVGATGRPRAGTPPRPGSRHIPAAVRRAVWARDGGRCAFVSRRGRRCTERGFLEFHHVRPYADGGPATVETIELRCRAHNGYEAERAVGPRGASQVREPASVYVTARRVTGWRRTRFEPSWTAAVQPP
ncbi:MAG TPA: HNH endonuclease signature motif containing protein [Thermodesulfobacteriota bacterium]